MGKLIRKMRDRRRDVKLSRELELRYRAQVDQRTEAAVQMTDDLRAS